MAENRHKSGFRGPTPDVGKETQFKPGVSGNLKGRPSSRPISDGYREFLSDPKELKKLIVKTVQLAQKGSAAHLREVTDRVDGPVGKTLHLTGEFEHDITSRDDVLRKLTELVERVSQRRKSTD